MSGKYFELEKRTYRFARDVRFFFKIFPKKFYNLEDIKQVLRSSGSICANYLEANEALGEKDFLMRIKISRKEAKETIYWLKLIYDISDMDSSQKEILKGLLKEAKELMNIFGSIYHKMK